MISKKPKMISYMSKFFRVICRMMMDIQKEVAIMQSPNSRNRLKKFQTAREKQSSKKLSTIS